MARRKTQEEYIEDVKKINPNITVVGEYVNAHEKILHKCLIDGYEWEATPNNILSGTGCPRCGRNIKRTQEDYIEDLHNKNPNVEVIGEYKNNRTNIRHRCKVCGYEWLAKPYNILNGGGCPKCRGNIKRTTEIYITEVAKVNQDIEVLGKYINNSTPILHRCRIDGNIWFAAPSNILSGVGCPKCGRKRSGNSRRKSHDQYVNEVLELNSNIEVVGTYENAHTPLLHKCLLCGHKWKARPNGILRGTGCPKCTHHISQIETHEEYTAKLAEVYPNNEVVERYVNMNTKILHRCLIHDMYWEQTPYNALKGNGCPQCSIEKIQQKLRKSQSRYIEEVNEVNPDIEVIGDYINNATPILHKCLIDGYEWMAMPSVILNGAGCPRCNESNGERKIRQWIEKNSIEYQYQYRCADCRDINILPFDFYLPEHNLCIEYDGIQHFKPIKWSNSMTEEESNTNFKSIQLHDNIKNNYCKSKGIDLLRIPYYKDIEEELNNYFK